MPDRKLLQTPWKLLWLSIKAQALFLWLALVYLLAGIGLTFHYPRMSIATSEALFAVGMSTFWVLLIVALCYLAVDLAVRQRPRHPLRQLAANLVAAYRSPQLKALGSPAFATLVILIYAFSNVKDNLQALAPFSWDRTFDAWDAALHFGRRPWEWLQPALGHWPVTFALNVNYNLWFFVMFAVWLHHAFMMKPGVARTRFFLAFMLVWIVEGSILALALSSAGPCFFGAGRLGLAPDPYAGLMRYLHQTNEAVPVWAVSLQDHLWMLNRTGLAAGISAMPSLHNGTTLLFALASTGWRRWVRVLLWLNVGIIFLGSIHLGWHYAVDAYVAWAATLAIWLAAAPLARLWENTPSAARLRRIMV